MVTVKEEMRKGPWTEQEDLQLVCFVRLFGERRWDFIAKVSGLNRTGKSCRLRWVNYLHPGLKRGRMTPQEERLILELHSRWGNRWSRIARKLPGRTDNEIKNYWRTHMRKKAQEYKRNAAAAASASAAAAAAAAAASSSSSGSSSSTGTSPSSCHGQPQPELAMESNELNSSCGTTMGLEEDVAGGLRAYSMDQIWYEIETSEAVSGLSQERSGTDQVCCSTTLYPPALPSGASDPLWKYCSDSLWKMDDDELCVLLSGMDQHGVFGHHHQAKDQSRC